MTVPVKQCAGRLVDVECATCKLIELPLAAVAESNTVTVSFPGGKQGVVGAAVLGAAYPVSVKGRQP